MFGQPSAEFPVGCHREEPAVGGDRRRQLDDPAVGVRPRARENDPDTFGYPVGVFVGSRRTVKHHNRLDGLRSAKRRDFLNEAPPGTGAVPVPANPLAHHVVAVDQKDARGIHPGPGVWVRVGRRPSGKIS